MVEVKDGKKILTTPISAEDLKGIKIGDIIYLNGSMTTCRDVAHRRLRIHIQIFPYAYWLLVLRIPSQTYHFLKDG